MVLHILTVQNGKYDWTFTISQFHYAISNDLSVFQNFHFYSGCNLCIYHTKREINNCRITKMIQIIKAILFHIVLYDFLTGGRHDFANTASIIASGYILIITTYLIPISTAKAETFNNLSIPPAIRQEFIKNAFVVHLQIQHLYLQKNAYYIWLIAIMRT
jgi:hypothetical protein